MEVSKNHRYDSYLYDLFEYDENSPSCLIWKKKTSPYSRAIVGMPAGNLDKSSGYYIVNLHAGKLRVNKIVWALFNNFENQENLIIDHIDQNKINNKKDNLRAVCDGISARNKPKNRNNTSGTTGVSFSEGFTKSGTYYSKYTAWVWFGNSKKAKTFSIQKYGEELAEFMAKEWRSYSIDLANLMGAGYTERHGTKE